MIKTARQLKDLIRNLSKDKSADAQILMRNYMMERFLERISLSEYRDKFILKGGMLVAAMGGLDAIVFTGGIGENNPQYRDRVCDQLKFMGVEINYEINDRLKRGPEGEISTPNSKVKVYVICTNEELMIARDTKEIVEAL